MVINEWIKFFFTGVFLVHFIALVTDIVHADWFFSTML